MREPWRPALHGGRRTGLIILRTQLLHFVTENRFASCKFRHIKIEIRCPASAQSSAAPGRVTSTTLFLVRHGAHDRLDLILCGRMEGVALNALGQRQAADLGRRLARDKLAAIYASPLTRTLETAEPIAAAHRSGIVIDADLAEIDMGAWTGKRFEELHGQSEWRRWNEQRLFTRPPGGETMLEVQTRVIRFIERIQGRHPDQTVCAVSHGDVIKAALAHAMGLSLDYHARLDIDPASLSAIVVGDWGMKVLRTNECRQNPEHEIGPA